MALFTVMGRIKRRSAMQSHHTIFGQQIRLEVRMFTSRLLIGTVLQQPHTPSSNYKSAFGKEQRRPDVVPVDMAQDDPIPILWFRTSSREALNYVIVAVYGLSRFNVFSNDEGEALCSHSRANQSVIFVIRLNVVVWPRAGATVSQHLATFASPTPSLGYAVLDQQRTFHEPTN